MCYNRDNKKQQYEFGGKGRGGVPWATPLVRDRHTYTLQAIYAAKARVQRLAVLFSWIHCQLSSLQVFSATAPVTRQAFPGLLSGGLGCPQIGKIYPSVKSATSLKRRRRKTIWPTAIILFCALLNFTHAVGFRCVTHIHSSYALAIDESFFCEWFLKECTDRTGQIATTGLESPIWIYSWILMRRYKRQVTMRG